MTYRDDPEYRKLMDEVIAWLADGRELAQLEKLVKDIKAQPRKHSSTHYKVKSPDGSVARQSTHSRVRAKCSVAASDSSGWRTAQPDLEAGRLSQGAW